MFKKYHVGFALVMVLTILPFLNSQNVAHATANLVADYRFNNTRSSSVGSAPALVDIGSNTFATETVDGNSCTVLTFAADNGLSLATNGVITSDTYSLVILFRFETTSGYRKIADFKNGTQDIGLYNLSQKLRFYTDALGTNTVFQDNVYSQVVLTRNGTTKQVTGYVDGAQEFQFDDTSDNAVIDAANTLRFLLDDNLTNSEESAGAVARIRVYDDVLTPSEVGGLDRTYNDCASDGSVTIDNTNLAIEYNGWQGVSDGAASGGTYRQSNTSGGKATIKFNGTNVKYFYRAAPNMGKVDVYIDKIKVKSLCLYAAAPGMKSKNFKNLASGKHTFELRVLNQTCNGSTDSYVSVDKIVSGATTLEDTASKWSWNGWSVKGNATANGGSYHSSKVGGAVAKLTFEGTAIRVLTLKGPAFGHMDVVVDGDTVETLNLDNAVIIAYSKNYEGLEAGTHTIELRRNALSGKRSIVVDGLQGIITLP
jgi:hypothetical protein